MSSPADVSPRDRTVGVATGVVSGIVWGSQYPLAKTVYRNVDPYTLTAIRYGLAGLAFVVLLWAIEGRRSLRYEGMLLRSILLGMLAGPVAALLVFLAVEHTRAQDVSLVVGMAPLITAVVNRVLGGPRLHRITVAAIVVAFLGTALVITHGDPASITDGRVGGIGIALAFLAMVGWAVYTVETGAYASWSPLRVSALTISWAGLGVTLIAVVAALVGWSHPVAAKVYDDAGLLAYLVVFATVLGMFGFNFARRRLGAHTTSLFMNLVPVTAFTFEAARGYRPAPAEIVGALLVVGALVANNVLLARVSRI